MRAAILAPVLAVLASLQHPAAASAPWVIAPGVGIGPVRIGAHAGQPVADHPCRVNTVARQGVIVAVTTAWGGACATERGTQVGMPLLFATAEFGPPDATARAETYPHGVAEWHSWEAGLLIRTVRRHDDSPAMAVITCIAVTPANPAPAPLPCRP